MRFEHLTRNSIILGLHVWLWENKVCKFWRDFCVSHIFVIIHPCIFVKDKEIIEAGGQITIKIVMNKLYV